MPWILVNILRAEFVEYDTEGGNIVAVSTSFSYSQAIVDPQFRPHGWLFKNNPYVVQLGLFSEKQAQDYSHHLRQQQGDLVPILSCCCYFLSLSRSQIEISNNIIGKTTISLKHVYVNSS